MKTYEIWSEGFRIMSEHADAHMIGKAKGNSFREACVQFVHDNPEWALNSNFNEEKLTHWGCGLFDNEEEARKSFG